MQYSEIHINSYICIAKGLCYLVSLFPNILRSTVFIDFKVKVGVHTSKYLTEVFFVVANSRICKTFKSR